MSDDKGKGGFARAAGIAKAERARIAAVTAERRDNLLRKELAWLRRGAPARTSKPKFRLDAASALIEANQRLRPLGLRLDAEGDTAVLRQESGS